MYSVIMSYVSEKKPHITTLNVVQVIESNRKSVDFCILAKIHFLKYFVHWINTRCTEIPDSVAYVRTYYDNVALAGKAKVGSSFMAIATTAPYFLRWLPNCALRPCHQPGLDIQAKLGTAMLINTFYLP